MRSANKLIFFCVFKENKPKVKKDRIKLNVVPTKEKQEGRGHEGATPGVYNVHEDV